MLFARSGTYWVPTRVSVTAAVDGRKASESIVFSGYRFPKTLPAATFRTGRALPPSATAVLSE
jgi:hypothetical protein